MEGALALLIGSFGLAGIGMILLALYFSVPTYSIDYCGQKKSYKGARNRYRSGKKVRLTYHLIATDTQYRFWLDGKELKYDYSENDGFLLHFIMPPHDTRLECHTKNISAIE